MNDQELALAADSLAKASTHKPGLEKKKGANDNWVERTGAGGHGQLPAYIQHVALAIKKKRGMDTSRSIAIAIGTVKRWARGEGNVDENTKAAATKAVAEWEAMKAKAHADDGKKLSLDTEIDEDALELAVFSNSAHPRDFKGRFRSAGGLKSGDVLADGSAVVTTKRVGRDRVLVSTDGGDISMSPGEKVELAPKVADVKSAALDAVKGIDGEERQALDELRDALLEVLPENHEDLGYDLTEGGVVFPDGSELVFDHGGGTKIYEKKS